MKLIAAISTAVLSLIIAVPVYARQEQHDQEQEKARPAQDEKRAQPERSAKPEEKGGAAGEERKTRREKRAAGE